jgi:hypothetical protein
MNKIWIIYAGMSSAGDEAENHPSIFYGSEHDANDCAYHMSIEFINGYEGSNGIPYFTSDEDLLEAGEDEDGNECVPYEEIENYTDYYVEVATLEKIEELGLTEEYAKCLLKKHY